MYVLQTPPSKLTTVDKTIYKDRNSIFIGLVQRVIIMKKHERMRSSIEFRCPYSFIQKVDEYVEQGRFSNDSEAYRALIQRGMQVEDILIIKNDPQRNSEFESKMKSILKFENLEQNLETCSETELRAIKDLTDIILNKKLHQSLLQIRES